MLIHLIRHTTPAINADTCYGQSDIDLASSFNQEKSAIHDKLYDSYDVVYSSPLKRCTLLADTIDAPYRYIDERLVEYNFGDWELKPWNQLKTPEFEFWMNNFVQQRAPSGDSIISMKARVDDFFEEVYRSNYERIAIVSHSGVQRLVFSSILESPLETLFRLQLDFGVIFEITFNQPNGIKTIRQL